jgi:hypothetical protein
MSIASIALQTTLWLLIGWVLLFCCWRQYRIDLLRQKLFVLRDEVFDIAAAGQMGFSDPHYVQTRQFLNAMIRYTHRITFTRAAFAAFFGRKTLLKVKAPVDAIREMPKGPVRDKLLSVHGRANIAIGIHLFTASPLPAMAFVGLVLHLAVRGMYKAYSEKVGSDRTVAAVERMAILSQAA